MGAGILLPALPPGTCEEKETLKMVVVLTPSARRPIKNTTGAAEALPLLYCRYSLTGPQSISPGCLAPRYGDGFVPAIPNGRW